MAYLGPTLKVPRLMDPPAITAEIPPLPTPQDVGPHIDVYRWCEIEYLPSGYRTWVYYWEPLFNATSHEQRQLLMQLSKLLSGKDKAARRG